jgi:hypothetical protein
VHSFDFVSFSDAALLGLLTSQDPRPNLLVVGTSVEVAAAVDFIVRCCVPPIHFCPSPGMLRLPTGKRGTLLLTGLAAMRLDQQIALYDWINETASEVQVVSVTTEPLDDLKELVERGLFLEGLFHRLNVVCLEAHSAPDDHVSIEQRV